MAEGGDADRRLFSAKGVLQRDFEVVAQIVAAARPGLAAAAAAHCAEHLFENVGEPTGETAGEIAGAAAATLECGVAEPVVSGALLVVLQDVISFADLFEFLL